MVSRRFVRLICLGLLAWVLIGCTNENVATPVPEPSPFASQLPLSAAQSPIPTPQAESQDLVPRDLTPEPGLATIQGMLYLDGKPAIGRTLYLAEIITPESEEGGGLAALDPVRDPRTESDASGYFSFLNVPPNRYTLGINSPVGPVLINRDGKEIIAAVQPDQIADLGEIHIPPFE